MNRLTNHRHAEESLRAYTNAKHPTPHLTQAFCASVAQMLADDTGAPAYVGLLGFRVVREPVRVRRA